MIRLRRVSGPSLAGANGIDGHVHWERNVYAVTFSDPFPIIYSNDVPRLVAFYVDAFGFEVSFRWPSEPDQPIEFANLMLGVCGIGVGRPLAPLHGRPVAASSEPANFELCIVADDVDAAARAVVQRGATLISDPVDQPWGERMAYVADPDGHPIMIYAKLDGP